MSVNDRLGKYIGKKDVEVFYTNYVKCYGAIVIQYYNVFYFDFDGGDFNEDTLASSPSSSSMLIITNREAYDNDVTLETDGYELRN